MTSIDFYTHVSDRFDVVAKLVAKAFAQHGSVRVLTGDAESTETLDRMLWIQPAISFLPQCRIGSRLAAETPIWIDHLLEHQGPAAVLINLHDAPPPFSHASSASPKSSAPTKPVRPRRASAFASIASADTSFVRTI